MKKILLLFLLTISCDNEYITWQNAINQFYFQALDSIDNIVIIPNEGCGGCITNVTHFFIENYKGKYESNTILVFTGVKDLKQLKIDIGQSLLKYPNVYVDKKNIFRHNTLSSIYPILIALKNIKVFSINIFDGKKLTDP